MRTSHNRSRETHTARAGNLWSKCRFWLRRVNSGDRNDYKTVRFESHRAFTGSFVNAVFFEIAWHCLLTAYSIEILYCYCYFNRIRAIAVDTSRYVKRFEFPVSRHRTTMVPNSTLCTDLFCKFFTITTWFRPFSYCLLSPDNVVNRWDCVPFETSPGTVDWIRCRTGYVHPWCRPGTVVPRKILH